MRTLIITLCVLMFSSNAQAGLFSAFSNYCQTKGAPVISGDVDNGNQLHDVFNNLFYESAAFVNDNQLYNTTDLDFIYNRHEEAWWGQTGDVFRVEMTYTSDPNLNALSILQISGESGSNYTNMYTDKLADFDTSDLNKYQQQNNNPDATYEVKGLTGFAWAISLSSGTYGTTLYSETGLNHQQDYFMAFSVTDAALLNHYYNLYNYDDASRSDELWVIAFDDPETDGSFTDMVAVISAGTAVPLPAPVLLMASGGFCLFFWRRTS